LGTAKVFLGMEIERDRAARTLKLTQRNFITNLASRFEVTDTVPYSIPMSPTFELHPTIAEAPVHRDAFMYQSLVGGLLYASTGTRPDIAFAICLLSRANNCYTQAHIDAALKVLRYAYHTRDMGLIFGTSHESFVGYCDASFAGDTERRRSTSGYVFLLFGGAVSWYSRRQDIVAMSTQEAEYIAACAAGKQALWLRTLWLDFTGSVRRIVIHTDNTAALTLLTNGAVSKRSKHIDLQYHFARNRVMRGELEYKYCTTDQMWADYLTKALPKAKFVVCRRATGVC
jgi:muramidase (phage lysozyme)